MIKNHTIKSRNPVLISFSNDETSSGIGEFDVEFLGTFNDNDAIFSRNVMSDLGSVDAVLHHEHFEFSNVTDDNFAETRGEHVLGSLSGSVTDAGHGGLSRETTTHTVINTLRFAPGFLDGFETIGLMALEGLGALLDNGRFMSRRSHLN